MAANQQTQSPLFRLPAELRNRIYEAASPTHDTNKEPSIFRTCHQIRKEGLKLFYATHTFSFVAKVRPREKWPAKEYHYFLTCIGAEKASFIEHLSFQVVDEYARFRGTDQLLGVNVIVTLDPEKVQVARAKYSRDDVAGVQVTALGNAKDLLNSAWGSHEQPTRAGLLRTVPVLVPTEVKIGEGQDQD